MLSSLGAALFLKRFFCSDNTFSVSRTFASSV